VSIPADGMNTDIYSMLRFISETVLQAITCTGTTDNKN